MEEGTIQSRVPLTPLLAPLPHSRNLMLTMSDELAEPPPTQGHTREWSRKAAGSLNNLSPFNHDPESPCASRAGAWGAQA